MNSPSQASADRWNRKLRFFRFHFAHGGHANDVDVLSAMLRMGATEAGLQDAFSRLGVAPSRIQSTLPGREAGRARDSAHGQTCADPIAAYPDYANPGFTSIGGMPVYLSVLADRIQISVSGAAGDPWLIDAQDYRNALALETLLPERGLRFVPVASRPQIEELFRVLKAKNLPDLESHFIARQALITKGTIDSATDPLLGAFAETRAQLGPGFADDEIWRDAHREIRTLVVCAVNYDANPHYVAHRCPGYTAEIIERICADTRFALR